jgi:putative membrane protein
MTRTTQIVCCAVLSFASSLMPSKAIAQSDDDKKFLAMATQSDQNEIALSKLAQQKTTNPAVKAFAAKMITEHTQMTASMKPFVDAWGLTPPTGPDADHQKELDELSGLSGNDFDKAYMKDMVSDHSKALSAFTKEAKDTKDAKFRAAVIKGKTAWLHTRTWLMIWKRNFSLYYELESVLSTRCGILFLAPSARRKGQSFSCCGGHGPSLL